MTDDWCINWDLMEDPMLTINGDIQLIGKFALGLLGPAGSGKDLVADWLVREKGFVKLSFADPMKRFVQKTFNFSKESLWGESKLRNEEIPVGDNFWFEAIGHFPDGSQEIVQDILQEGNRVEGFLKLHNWLSHLRNDHPHSISPRVILQTLGTEWGREVDPYMWIRYAHNLVHELSLGDRVYDQVNGLLAKATKAPVGVVIPDHRFKNEVEYTKEKGGHVTRLRRIALEKTAEVGVKGHASEAEQQGLPDSLFDSVLNLPEGVAKVYGYLDPIYDLVWNRS